MAKLEVAKERKVGRKEKSKKGRVWIPFEKMRIIELANFMFEYTLVGGASQRCFTSGRTGWTKS